MSVSVKICLSTIHIPLPPLANASFKIHTACLSVAFTAGKEIEKKSATYTDTYLSERSLQRHQCLKPATPRIT